jgi:hypothetical protein
MAIQDTELRCIIAWHDHGFKRSLERKGVIGWIFVFSFCRFSQCGME